MCFIWVPHTHPVDSLFSFLSTNICSNWIHPQLFVPPLKRLFMITFLFFPQSHWHFQKILPLESLFSTGFMAISFPNFSPVKSIALPILIHLFSKLLSTYIVCRMSLIVNTFPQQKERQHRFALLVSILFEILWDKFSIT